MEIESYQFEGIYFAHGTLRVRSRLRHTMISFHNLLNLTYGQLLLCPKSPLWSHLLVIFTECSTVPIVSERRAHGVGLPSSQQSSANTQSRIYGEFFGQILGAINLAQLRPSPETRSYPWKCCQMFASMQIYKDCACYQQALLCNCCICGLSM